MDVVLEKDQGKSHFDIQENALAVIVPSTQRTLPILSLEPLLGKHLNHFQTVLVISETASGKSTQVPQMLARLGWCKNGFQIAIVQPNALTAQRLAARLRDETGSAVACLTSSTSLRNMDTSLGDFFTVFDPPTFLRFGLAQDPLLSSFSLVLLDEVHERVMVMDVIFGLLVRVMNSKRLGLRLVLCSATMDAQSLLRYFPNSSLISLPFSSSSADLVVDVAYLSQPCEHYLNAICVAIRELHLTEKPEGDILVFVPCQEDCEYLVRRIAEENPFGVLVLPLHEGMSTKNQELVLTTGSTSKRKIIVSTPLAETSVTIPGIRIVVDSMFVQQVEFHHQVHSLVTRPISKSTAQQRLGRVGRIGGGRCFRLCTERAFQILCKKHSEPEIFRADIADMVIMLKWLRVDNLVTDFNFITRPTSAQFVAAFELLFSLGAIDSNGELTEIGEWMAQMQPLPVRLAKVLWLGAKSRAVTNLVALLSSGVGATLLTTFPNHIIAQCAAKEGDHLTVLNLLAKGSLSHELKTKFELKREHLLDMLAQFPPSSEKKDSHDVLACVYGGFLHQIAKLQSNGLYKTLKENRLVRLHPTSVLHRFGKPPEFICFQECVLIPDKHYRVFKPEEEISVVRLVSQVDPRWLQQIDKKEEGFM